MNKVELIMPKMGESVAEATIISWQKEVGDSIGLDETIIEIATDKVDSEVPSSYEGKLIEKLFDVDDVVKVGEAFGIIEINDGNNSTTFKNTNLEKPSAQKEVEELDNNNIVDTAETIENEIIDIQQEINSNSQNKFYSPLVKAIASKENISISELNKIKGTGNNNRVTKFDILEYLKTKENISVDHKIIKEENKKIKPSIPKISISGNKEIIEMDRMRKLIADHMVMSKQTSPHVTSFVEADVTELVNWRNNVKKDFENKEGEKITFTPIFIEAVVKAIRDFPMINVSVEGKNIVIHKDINIGMATALPSGNLIVPVIKGASQMNLRGLTKTVNDLASRARKNQLKPDEIQNGTFTFTNVGSFGNVMGTPIINQPQVAIMAVGAIKKKPAVIETIHGDMIGIRHMMFLSLSYDHRVVDGALGGSFLRKVADYLEQFDPDTKI